MSFSGRHEQGAPPLFMMRTSMMPPGSGRSFPERHGGYDNSFSSFLPDCLRAVFSRRLPCHWQPGCVQRNRRCLTNRLRMRSMRRRRIRINPYCPQSGHVYGSDASAWRVTGTLAYTPTARRTRSLMPIPPKNPLPVRGDAGKMWNVRSRRQNTEVLILNSLVD